MTKIEQNVRMDLAFEIQQKALKEIVNIKKYKSNTAAKIHSASDSCGWHPDLCYLMKALMRFMPSDLYLQ